MIPKTHTADHIIRNSDVEVIENIDCNYLVVDKCLNLKIIRNIRFNFLKIYDCDNLKHISGYFKSPETKIGIQLAGVVAEKCIFYKADSDDITDGIDKIHLGDIPLIQYKTSDIPTLWNPTANPTSDTVILHTGCGHVEVIDRDISTLHKVGGDSFTIQKCPNLTAIDDCSGESVNIKDCPSLRWIRNIRFQTAVCNCPMLEHAHDLEAENAIFTDCQKLKTVDLSECLTRYSTGEIVSYGSMLRVTSCPSLSVVQFRQKLYDDGTYTSSDLDD